jgi:WD40 repeat protein
LVSGDKNGEIWIWSGINKFTTQQLTIIQFLKQTGITCLKFSFDSLFLAIGYQNGVILIVNISTLEIFHKLFGHEEEIQSLSWRNSKEHILASSSKDKMIRIWKLTEKDFECTSVLKTESKNNSSVDKRTWISCCFNPHFPKMLISSSIK